MRFKYAVGKTVRYRPPREREGLYTVLQQMPEQAGVAERRYRIKSLLEGFERNVSEADLRPDSAKEIG